MKRIESPYSAAVTGGGFLFDETEALLPLLMSPDRTQLLKDEIVNNEVLHINLEKSRARSAKEIERRYHSVPPAFWIDYMDMDITDRKIALLYVILRTYKIFFDFHINVCIRRWNSVGQRLELSDLMLEFNEISARDEFVDSWAESTKKKVASTYLSVLRKCGMIDSSGTLSPLRPSNASFYLRMGETWFLEACFMAPYQIENIKKEMS